MFEKFTEYLTGSKFAKFLYLLRAENSSASGGNAPPPDQGLCP